METKQSQFSPADQRENIMGTMDINPLLFRISVPMMISMLVQALYNMADALFTFCISEKALTAVSLSAPVLGVMVAVGMGTGTGVGTLLAKSLGKKEPDKVASIAANGFFLTLCSAAVFMLIGFFGLKPYFHARTDDEEIIRYGVSYLSICCMFSVFLFVQTMGEKLLTATGRTRLSMISQLTGLVVNLILDPIFIFGYCGEALSGTTGAAVTTAIGKFVSAAMTVYFNLRKNPDVRITFKGFRPSAKIIGQIYAIGMPSIAMRSVSSVKTVGVQQILLRFSLTAVALYSICEVLQAFVYMPVFGLTNGMEPIVAYNCGARRPERVKKAIRLSVLYAEIVMVIGALVLQIAPRQVLTLLKAGEAMTAIGVPAMRILSLSLLLAGARVVLSMVFQAMGNGLFGLMVMLTRQVVVLLPAAELLARTGELNHVWWAFFIAEAVSLLLSLILYARISKTVIAPLSEPCAKTVRE